MGLELGPAGVSGAQRQLLYEAAESGIRDGFTVPIHNGRGPIAAVTFTANVRNTTAFRRRVDEHKRVLQLMAMYFHAHARRKLIPDRTVDLRKRLDPKRPIRL
jgi:LuxR family transcriptional activator of conjugal transfer of Ti plasmids